MKNIKKLTSVILAVVLIFAMSSVAFAAPGSGTPIENSHWFGYYRMVSLIEEEEPLWDYDPETRLYVDENGTTWKYVSEYVTIDFHDVHKNVIVAEDHIDGVEMYYSVLKDTAITTYSDFKQVVNLEMVEKGTLGITVLAEDGVTNLEIPATVDGKKVTQITDVSGQDLMSVVIPDGVTEIGYEAFFNQKALKRIVIPDSVKIINVNAFFLSEGIEIYYCGTEDQWNDIIVWNINSSNDKSWAVKEFDWLGTRFSDEHCTNENYHVTGIKAVHFNADPSTLEDIVPEEKQESPFDGFLEGIRTFFATITNFFKVIVSWFTFGK